MIKDSGDRTEFESGAVRDMHEGKGRMDLLPWAAIMEVSKSSTRAVTIRKTKGRQKVVWAIKIVTRPRLIFIELKKISRESPIITSGKTIGRKLMVWI